MRYISNYSMQSRDPERAHAPEPDLCLTIRLLTPDLRAPQTHAARRWPQADQPLKADSPRRFSDSRAVGSRWF